MKGSIFAGRQPGTPKPPGNPVPEPPDPDAPVPVDEPPDVPFPPPVDPPPPPISVQRATTVRA